MTVTSAKSPIIQEQHCKHLNPGTLIVAMGADGTGKQEIDVSLFKQREVGLALADSKKQCVSFGELSHPISQGVLKEEDVLELGLYLASPEKYKSTLKAKYSAVAPIIFADSTGIYKFVCNVVKQAYTSILPNLSNLKMHILNAGVAVQDVAIAKFCLERMRAKK